VLKRIKVATVKLYERHLIKDIIVRISRKSCVAFHRM